MTKIGPISDSFDVQYRGIATEQWEFDLGRSIKVTGIDEFKLKIHSLLPEVRENLEQIIRADGQKLRDRARALAEGPAVKERSGKFVASIQFSLRSDETGVFGTVYSDDPRDPLFEYGGNTAARDILPNVTQALRFLGGSPLLNTVSLGTAGMVYAAIVHRPVVTYPPHPVIHAAFEEMEPTIEHDIEVGTHGAIIHMDHLGVGPVK